MNIPFYKWMTWIEDFLSKEFMRLCLLKATKRGDGFRNNKPVTKTFIKAEELATEKILAQAKFFNQELEMHN